MRTNVVLDDELVREAFSLTGIRTKRELIDTALRALVRASKRKNLLELSGRLELREDYDHKALRQTRDAGGVD